MALTSDGVETYIVDANYTESDTTKYLGKVKYDTDNINQTLEEAIEAEDIHIDTWALKMSLHQLTKIKLVETNEPMGVTGLSDKEESDVDVAFKFTSRKSKINNVSTIRLFITRLA